jgi:hypothetical protein
LYKTKHREDNDFDIPLFEIEVENDVVKLVGKKINGTEKQEQ